MSEGMDETYRDEDDLEFESWVRKTSDTMVTETEAYLAEVDDNIVNMTKAMCMQIQSYLGGEDVETAVEIPAQRQTHRFLPRVRSMFSILGLIIQN
jgi:hypothetical protein